MFLRIVYEFWLMFSTVGLMSLESFQHRKFPSFVALAVKGFTVCFVLKRMLLPQSSFIALPENFWGSTTHVTNTKLIDSWSLLRKVRGLLSATKVTKLSFGWVRGLCAWCGVGSSANVSVRWSTGINVCRALLQSFICDVCRALVQSFINVQASNQCEKSENLTTRIFLQLKSRN